MGTQVLNRRRRATRPWWVAWAIAAGGLVAFLPLLALAHDIPSDVTVQAFVRPDGRRLWLLVRVPLRAMRDMEFPLRGPGYLDLARAGPELRRAAGRWIGDAVVLYEDDTPLGNPELVAARASIPGDGAFGRYDDALAQVTGPPLPEATDLYWDQAMLDVLFQYPIRSDRSRFSIRPRLERLAERVVTVLRFLPPGGAVRAFEYSGDPGVVRLDPRWRQAAASFLRLGFRHILDGMDHLVFLVALVIPFRRLRTLIPIVTAFTVAHSVTLLATATGAAPGALWFPPLVETLIAASIVYTALENIVGAALTRRWLITVGFGLIHGFGFSFALRQQLQFAGSHLLTSLLAFNLGVELGQLLVLVLLVPLLEALFRFAVAERMGTILLSALVAHTGWHWMTARGAVLGRYRLTWPGLDTALPPGTLRWLTPALLLAAVGWLLVRRLRRPAARPPAAAGTAAADE